MSSAAVQPSASALSNRPYQPSSLSRDQYYTQQSSITSTVPQSSRKHPARPSNGASPQTPTGQHQSPAGSNASSITPRAQPFLSSPANESANLTGTPAAGPSQASPSIQPPPRTSSQHHRTPTATAPAIDNRSTRTGSSTRSNAAYNDISDQPDSSSSRRRTTQQSPREPAARDGVSSRGKPSPGQSRSASQADHPPRGPDLPREESTIISRLVASDPQEDIAREQARMAEARGIPAGADITPITGLGLVGSNGVDDGGRRASKARSTDKSDRPRKEILFGEYVLGQTLGEGEFGKVKMGWKKNGGVQVAIKLIKRETVEENPNRLPKIYREIAILRGLQHPNIVRLHEMVETERHIGIILEYASGGELFDYILQHRFLKDSAARRLFAQLVSGVGYLHKKGIVHRDLKLENLLLDRNRNIIITDFGFANTFNPNDDLDGDIEYRLSDRDYVKKMGLELVGSDGHRRGDLMQTSCGSPCYAAPELVVSDTLYTGKKVDVWSCGVILYAMLAGYLPFDDDPANPEGDNINLLYKYIVSTPLTFPEYVTPHARDLLKRILVPDPRKRADLFEVARHSWLSEYAHVVGFITSSTTTETDIINATVPADSNDAPLLARSASVREPSKSHVAVPAVGGLAQKTGQVDQPSEKGKTPRDVKRRTVQVEYVAPQSSTARGEPTSASRTRVRSGSQGLVEVAPPPPPPPPKNYEQTERKQPASAAPGGMPPPARPARDQQRAASESVTQSGMSAPSSQRPSTQGSMTGTARLPSRGNSYGQPAVAVTQEQAQGRFSQPKKQHYTISSPNREEQALMDSSSYGEPARPVQDSYSQDPRRARRVSHQQKSHKRSNTIGERIGSMFGRPSMSYEQKQSEKAEREQAKRHPPMVMKQPFIDNGNSEPRQSGESRRTSFSFSRKNTDQSSSQRSSRRFSLIQSLKGFGSKDSQQYPPGSAGSEQRRVVSQPRSRQDSRPRMGFRSGSRSPSRSTTNSNTPGFYDDRLQGSPTQRPAAAALTSAPAQQGAYSTQPYAAQTVDPYAYQNGYESPADTPVNAPTQSYTQPQQQQDVPFQPGKYPPGFNDYDDMPIRAQGGRLQKHKRFTEAYDNERGAGAPRRVMDFFRRVGSRRQGEDR